LVPGLWLATVTVGEAQRVQFPSPVGGATMPGPPAAATAPPAGSLPYTVAQPPYGVASPPAASGGIAPPPVWDPYSGAAQGAAPIGPPAATPYNAAPSYAAPPNVAPNSSLPPVYSPPPTYPGYGGPSYAPPVGANQPSAILPDGLPFSWQPGTYSYQNPDGTTVKYQRFLQNIGFEYTWLAELTNNDKKFEVHRADFWSSFGLPIFYNTETPLLVTPGFAVNVLEGPITVPLGGPNAPDLPPRLYDAYLDGAWQPQLNELLGGDLGVRVGVYSDFNHVTNDSIRFMGRGLGLIAFTPTVKLAAGVWYLDRNNVKLLPAGGIIWTPNPDTNFRILFPNPKLSRRFATVGTSEWWWYFTGEYGGGAWTVDRNAGINGGFSSDRIDYNDLRAAFGLEWIGCRGVRGHIEAGYVWDREILFVDSKSPASWKPDDTLMIRAGIDF
jgi:hypothetical protein